MRYLVTGATGFIGSEFIHSLKGEDSVVAVTRNPDNAKPILNSALCSISYLTDLSSLKHLDDIDCVVNLAGEPIADKRWTDSQKHKIQQSRWGVTTSLTRLIEASKTPPDTFISGSAIGFYGRQGSTPVTESTTQIHDEFSHKLCATWESMALAAQSQNTRVCVLRTGIVLGKGKGALAKMTLPFKLGLGGKIGEGNQGMSWIHIDDMVRGIHFLINNENCNGVFNFTAPNPVDNKTFVSTLGKVLNRPTVLPAPAFALKLAMGESADLLLTGQFVLPAALQQAGFTFTYGDLEHALRAVYS